LLILLFGEKPVVGKEMRKMLCARDNLQEVSVTPTSGGVNFGVAPDFIQDDERKTNKSNGKYQDSGCARMTGKDKDEKQIPPLRCGMTNKKKRTGFARVVSLKLVPPLCRAFSRRICGQTIPGAAV
jgi:hypothetical protein